MTFARIKEATSAPGLDPKGWCFFVLTLDRDGYFSGRPWANVTAAYRALGKLSEKFLKRLRRKYGLKNQWVAVVEAHRSGWPHVNLLVYCPELASELRIEHAERLQDPELASALEIARSYWKRRKECPNDVRERARRTLILGGDLLRHALESGWGCQSSAEAARDVDSLAGYVVKLAGEGHEKSIGELAKVTQAPLAAPGRFRRLRSGKGFLPPRHKNPAVTGALVRCRRSCEGDWEILAVNASKDPAQHEPILQAIRAEQACIEEEEELLSHRLPVLGLIRQAFGGKLQPHRENTERRWAMTLKTQTQDG